MTGDAVNVAARLEQAAAPGEVLLGEPTYRLVRDAVDGRAGRAARARRASRSRSPPTGCSRSAARAGAAAGRDAARRARGASSSCSSGSSTPVVAERTLPAGHGRRRAGRRQVAPRRRARRADRHAGARRPRRLPLLRRGHHLLGGRPDRARAGRDRGRALARRGARADRGVRRRRAERARRRRRRIAQLLGLAEGAATARGDGVGDPRLPRRRRRATGRWSCSSTTSTGPSRRCSTCSPALPGGDRGRTDPGPLPRPAGAARATGPSGTVTVRARAARRRRRRRAARRACSARRRRGARHGSRTASAGNPLFAEELVAMLVDEGVLRSRTASARSRATSTSSRCRRA